MSIPSRDTALHLSVGVGSFMVLALLLSGIPLPGAGVADPASGRMSGDPVPCRMASAAAPAPCRHSGRGDAPPLTSRADIYLPPVVAGALSFENTTLLIANTTVVNTSASLDITNCTLIFRTGNGYGTPPTIVVNGTLNITGTHSLPSPFPDGSAAGDDAIGHILSRGTSTFLNSTFRAIAYTGTNHSYIENCSYEGPTPLTLEGSVRLMDSHIGASGPFVISNATVQVLRCDIVNRSGGAGIDMEGCVGTVVGCNITNNSRYGLHLLDTNVTLQGNEYSKNGSANVPGDVWIGYGIDIHLNGYLDGLDGYDLTLGDGSGSVYAPMRPRVVYRNNSHIHVILPYSVTDGSGTNIHDNYTLVFKHPLFREVDTAFDPYTTRSLEVKLELSNGPVNALVVDIVGPDAVLDGGSWVGNTTLYSTAPMEYHVLLDGNLSSNGSVDGWTELPLELSIPYGLHDLSVIVDPAGSHVDGNRTDDRARLQVLVDRPPVAMLGADRESAGINETVTFNIDGTDDSDGGILNITLDTGDGFVSFDPPGSVITHSYTRAGPYMVVVAITDEFGLNDSASFRLNITETSLLDQVVVNLTLLTTPVNVTAPAVISLAGTRWGPDGLPGVRELAVNFGDEGRFEDVDLGRFRKDGLNISHRYMDDGHYVVAVRIRYPFGEVIGILNLTVENLPPRAVATGPTGKLLVSLPFNVTLSANGTTDPDDTELEYVWVVNGRSYNGSEITFVAGSYGSYLVRLGVTDDDGAQAVVTWSFELGRNVTGTGSGDGNGAIIPVTLCIASVLVIVVVVLLGVLVLRGRRGAYSIDEEALGEKGAHRLDLAILQKSGSEHYVKYELYGRRSDVKGGQVCIVWDSPEGGVWEIVGTFVGGKEEIAELVKKDLDRLSGKGYDVDYGGKGLLIRETGVGGRGAGRTAL